MKVKHSICCIAGLEELTYASQLEPATPIVASEDWESLLARRNKSQPLLLLHRRTGRAYLRVTTRASHPICCIGGLGELSYASQQESATPSSASQKWESLLTRQNSYFEWWYRTNGSSVHYTFYGRWIRIDLLYKFYVSEKKIKLGLKTWSWPWRLIQTRDTNNPFHALCIPLEITQILFETFPHAMDDIQSHSRW